MREIYISVEPGRYVVAVSGGVDSVVLLDLLRQLPGLKLTVAHFDHGIRRESGGDRLFVEDLAKRYGLPFVFEEGHLGTDVSEATARDARYAFLRRVMRETTSSAIITAHHEDDLLETAILNLIRGTGRKGLSSLKDTEDILRPLLHVPKADIIAYAKQKHCEWHEDQTNASTVYLRNYIRLKILPRFTSQDRTAFRALIGSASDSNAQIDSLLTDYLQLQPSADTLRRHEVVILPHAVSKEMIAAWLRAHDVRSFDRKAIERITVAVKTYAPGKQIDVDGRHFIRVEKELLALTLRER